MILLRFYLLIPISLRIFAHGFGFRGHLQDILVKHKALTIISRSQKKKPEKLISF